MTQTQEARPIFGVSVLETLTVGMYTNPLDCIRELVQNSFDSIRSAVKVGQISAKEGRIDIVLDDSRRSISVRDNGTGIPSENARARLSNVGQSLKSLEDDIGFRGIGRLHGIAYCDRLVFKTSVAGEAVASVVTFDAKGLRALMSPVERRNDTAEEILYACTDLATEPELADEHYFEATLIDVSGQVAQLLDFDEVYGYLSQVAPVDFDTAFYYATKVRKWAQNHGVEVPHASVRLKSTKKERFVFKPYKTSYKPLRDTKTEDKESERIEVTDVAFYPEDGPHCNGVWIWYSKGNLLGQIGDRNASGIRLRKQNMSVGGASRIEELIPEARFNKYFIGEVHVHSQACIPNARRDGFEDTREWAAIRDQLTAFLKEREKEVRTSSNLRSDKVGKAIRGAQITAEKILADAASGITSNQEREKLLRTLDDQKAKLDEIAPAKITEELKAAYEAALTEITEATTGVQNADFVLAQAKGQLDRKQKKLLQDVLETLRDCLPPDTFKLARDAIMARFDSKYPK